MSDPADPNLYQRSGDGQWWHLKTAEFVRGYGKTNPYEDWATVWEYYFDEFQSGSGTPGANLSAKLLDVQYLFAALRGLI
jgi:hypothetical protein